MLAKNKKGKATIEKYEKNVGETFELGNKLRKLRRDLVIDAHNHTVLSETGRDIWLEEYKERENNLNYFEQQKSYEAHMAELNTLKNDPWPKLFDDLDRAESKSWSQKLKGHIYTRRADNTEGGIGPNREDIRETTRHANDNLKGGDRTRSV